MNKEILTRKQITKIVLGSYSNRLIVTILFCAIWAIAVLGVILCISFSALANDGEKVTAMLLFSPSVLLFAALAIVMTFVIIKRAKRWNVRKQEIEEGKHYSLREVTLREVIATPKGFDKCDYVLYFDGCSAYDLPDESYTWSKKMHCNAETAYKQAKVGTTYYALIRDENALLLGVFPTKYFEIEE